MPRIQTASGRSIDLSDLYPEDITAQDIAHGLVHTCRFGGQGEQFYSVAQHSLNVHRAVERVDEASAQQQLYAILHDASEAYLGDVPRPVKQVCPDYRALEQEVMDAVWDWIGISPPDSNTAAESSWKAADLGVFEWEAEKLLNGYQSDPETVDRYRPACTLQLPENSDQIQSQFEQSLTQIADEVSGVRIDV